MRPELIVTAVGDLALYGKVPATVTRLGVAAFCDEAAAVLAPGALRFGNLEVPLVESARIDEVYLCGPLELADLPRALGLNVLSLANNHIMDAGPEGLETTLRAVRERGIATAGAGRHLAEARQPALVEAGGARIGVLAYAEGHKRLYHHVATADTPGVAPIDEALVCEDLAALRRRVDVVVLSLHWGVNYMRFAMPEQRQLAKAFAAAGADLILGHHPHVLQGIERIGETLVAYSLGDFVSDPTIGNVIRAERVAARRRTAVLTVHLSGSGPSAASWTPFRADEEFRPRRLAGDEAQAALAELAGFDRFYEPGRYPDDPWAEAGQEIGGHALAVIWFHLRRGNLGYLAKRLFRIRTRHLKMLKGYLARR
ncbi:MAG: CapA family protein [Acidobacteria bacterium]|nr:CapA family protein [Acidobacteriota bacterium]